MEGRKVAFKSQKQWNVKSIFGNNDLDGTDSIADEVAVDFSAGNEQYSCGINPGAIKTIKSSQFASSYIATKEFEKRIVTLHNTKCGSDALNMYINNLQFAMVIFIFKIIIIIIKLLFMISWIYTVSSYE